MLGERIPLRWVKTMRKTLSGKNMLNSFLKEHAYSQSVPDFFSWLKSNYSPTEKHRGCEYFGRMVLHSAIWCSTIALRLIWRCLVECWGWGSCRRQRHWKTGTPPRGEGTLILNCWTWWLAPAITRWHINIHFCVKDVSLVWGWLLLPKWATQL